MANSIIVQSRSSKFFTPSASTNGRRSRSTISSSIIPPTMPIGDQFQSSPDDCTRSFESVNQILRLALGLWTEGAKSTETCRNVGNGSDLAVRFRRPAPASPSPADLRHDNQVVALGPMLSASDPLSFLEKIAV